MELTPQKILQEYQNNNLDKKSAIKLLISLIEDSNDDKIREESIYNFQKIGDLNDNLVLFYLLENLLISDLNEKIRNAAAKLIRIYFLDKALKPMKWALQYESDYDCLISIIKILVDIKNEGSKEILIKEIKNIKKEKYLDKSKRIDNKKFRSSIKKLLKVRKYNSFSHEELAQIIINYKTMASLTNKFYSVYFELKNALVYKLDLADVEYEVRGWMSDFKNNIRTISEIIGLKNLTHLKSLNLSNNLISNVKELKELESLTHLYLSNNKISDIENVSYIKKIPKLVYLDISGNKFVEKINKLDFKNLEVKLKKINY